MVEDTVVCTKLRTTAKQVHQLLRDHEREKIATFLQARFEERYFDPIHAIPLEARNGFLTIGISCLTLESLETFHQGKRSSKHKTREMFVSFLERETSFASLASHANEFYENVRCGILHQGETGGGWRVKRRGPLFEEETLTLNATRFHKALHTALLNYVGALRTRGWKDPIWKNCRKKLTAVLENCGSEASNL
jgi:hypothetical protein